MASKLEHLHDGWYMDIDRSFNVYKLFISTYRNTQNKEEVQKIRQVVHLGPITLELADKHMYTFVMYGGLFHERCTPEVNAGIDYLQKLVYEDVWKRSESVC